MLSHEIPVGYAAGMTSEPATAARSNATRGPWFAFWCWPWWIWGSAVVIAPLIYFLSAAPACYALDSTTSVPLQHRLMFKNTFYGPALWYRKQEIAYRELWDYEWFLLIETFGEPGQ